MENRIKTGGIKINSNTKVTTKPTIAAKMPNTKSACAKTTKQIMGLINRKSHAKN